MNNTIDSSTVDALNAILIKNKVDFEIIKHDKPIKSKKDAEGYFNLNETAPTLILKTNKGYFATTISGEREKIDFNNLKSLLKVDDIKMADRDEIKNQFNIIAGQVALVGNDFPCILDKKLLKHKYVYGGTGHVHFTLKINPSDLEKVNNVVLKFD